MPPAPRSPPTSVPNRSTFSRNRQRPTDQVQFDDLATSPVTALPPSVGTYQFITYNAWAVGSVSGEVTGIAAHTEPNIIATLVETQLIKGTPSLTVASPYTAFGLIDFWFGCNIDSVGVDGIAVAEATQCTVAAFDGSSDKEVALAAFTFTPTDAG